MLFICSKFLVYKDRFQGKYTAALGKLKSLSPFPIYTNSREVLAEDWKSKNVWLDVFTDDGVVEHQRRSLENIFDALIVLYGPD